MSALPTPPATAPADAVEARFEALTLARLDAVLDVEQRAYSHPWTRGNFTDAMASGYQAQLLMAGDRLLGYFVAMLGVDEVHLLNITVAPEYQRQGWARVLLDALALWSRGRGAQWLWLEVRVSNLRAQQIYETHGYRRVGERKRYYPAAGGQRDAWLRASVLARDFDFSAPLRPVAPDLLVSVAPASDWVGPPLRLQPVRYLRHRPELKHAGTFALFDLRRQAMAAGWDDALFIDEDGHLVEGTTWNLGLWNADGVTWPVGPALRGTQERLLQQGLAAIGGAQQARPVRLAELAGFQGAFACNARGIRAIGAIGGHGFAAGEPWRAALVQALESQPWQAL